MFSQKFFFSQIYIFFFQIELLRMKRCVHGCRYGAVVAVLEAEFSHTQCFLLTAPCVTLFSLCSAAGPVSSCGWRPAAGNPLNGLSHRESVGGCCMGGVEHRGLHLWLHPHQRHGAAHPCPGERHHHPPMCDRAAVRRHIGTLHLHPLQEALKMRKGVGWAENGGGGLTRFKHWRLMW